MSQHHLINVRSAEIKRQPRDVYEDQPRVRVYRYSPDRVALQIRTGKGYATALLTFAEAEAIASKLINEVKNG